MNLTAAVQNATSLQDLMWEHEKFKAGLQRLFDKYVAELSESDTLNYDRATERIIFNTIRLLEATCSFELLTVCVDYHAKSLRLLLIVDEASFREDRDKLYGVMPLIQKMSIKHEGRDFRWRLMPDRHVERECLGSEFSQIFEVKSAA